MAFTQEQIEALEAAIATGTLKVKYADREVTYQDTASMLKALAVMKGEVAAAAGEAGFRRIATNKGLC